MSGLMSDLTRCYTLAAAYHRSFILSIFLMYMCICYFLHLFFTHVILTELNYMFVVVLMHLGHRNKLTATMAFVIVHLPWKWTKGDPIRLFNSCTGFAVLFIVLHQGPKHIAFYYSPSTFACL